MGDGESEDQRVRSLREAADRLRLALRAAVDAGASIEEAADACGLSRDDVEVLLADAHAPDR